MEQILENLDLSEEVKSALTESFNAAVLAEAEKMISAKEAEYEAYIQKQLAEYKQNLEEKLDEYLDRVVNDFVSENEIAMEESVNGERFETILEGINSVLIAAGVEIAQIVEAKKDSDAKLAEKAREEVESEKIDSLMEEILALKATNAELLKTGLIKESMENMSSIQKEKFMKLASVVEFDAKAPELFINKLDTLAEAVQSKPDKVEIQESIVESVKVSKEPLWKTVKHLY